jgi:hypothetical protein
VRARISAAAVVALLALPAAASAETFTVENTSNDPAVDGSLGHTIMEAGPGDTIEIPPGTYYLTAGETLVDQQNILVGAGEGETTVIPTGGGDALEAVEARGITEGEALNPEEADDADEPLDTKVQIVALIATLAMFGVVLELVRRRRLAERYALLWMSVAVILLILAIWRNGLDVIADAMGIADPANAIFILAIGAAFVLLLHFSVATSRLSEETKILAQEAARLDHELRVARGEERAPNGDSAAAAAEQREAKRPVAPQDGA